MHDGTRENIERVEITDTGKVMLVLRGGGKPEYQYIYREASSVYWDDKAGGFKSAEAPREWSCADWFFHIVSVTRILGLNLTLNAGTQWKNVPEEDRNTILESVRTT